MISILILIIIFLIYISNCSIVEDCENHQPENCTSIGSENDDFRCFRTKIKNNNRNYEKCMYFPLKKEIQETAMKMRNSIFNEVYSFMPLTKYKLNNTSGYDITENFILESINDDIDEQKIRGQKNYCGYHLGNYVVDFLMDGKIYDEKSLFPICYNVDSFDISKNLIKCGIGKLKVMINGEEKIINTCQIMPDLDHLKNGDILIKYFNKLYNYVIIYGLKSYIYKGSDKGSFDYEVSIKDKEGHVYKINSAIDDYEISQYIKNVTLKVQYCLYKKNELILNVLELKDKEIILHPMESTDRCNWSAKVLLNEELKYKFVVAKKDSIKKWQPGDYNILKVDEVNDGDIITANW